MLEPQDHHVGKNPYLETCFNSLSSAKKKGDQGGATQQQDAYRDLILDLAAHIPLKSHGTFALHLAREEELLGNGHPGC